MDKPPVVVVDADALIAQANPNDVHHKEASAISSSLLDKRAQVIYPTTAIIEAATHMQRVLNSTPSAYGTANLMIDPAINVAEVSKKTLTHSLEYFSPITSKKNTLFDCVVAAVAHENNADAIFSFDKFYKTKGFKLASEL